MKSYTKVYLDHLRLTTADFIPCEICQNQAVDIHHIWARSIRKDLENDINNLMALCREHHIEYGDKKMYREWLQGIHNTYLNQNKHDKSADY